MPCCVFFGHKDTDSSIAPKLKLEIEKLIQENGVNEFLIGNNGKFDYIVYSVLKGIKTANPDVRYSVVLAYLPGEKTEYTDYYLENETFLPSGIEIGPKQFAIDHQTHRELHQQLPPQNSWRCTAKNCSSGGASIKLETSKKLRQLNLQLKI